MKNKIIAISFLCALLCSFSVKAQQGKDGVANITATGTVVNIYTPLTVSVSAGATKIVVASTASFSPGDLIYIIQMQGATIRDSVNYYGNPNDALPRDTGVGKINSYNGAGNNEFAEITAVSSSGDTITLDCGLKNTYSDSLGGYPNTQVIRVPRYVSLTLSGTAQITCPAWNGTTGGVVVIEVQGNTTIGAGTSINVAGKGFRGGAIFNDTNYGGTNVGFDYTTHNGARKGESIVGDSVIYERKTHWHSYDSYWVSTPFATCKGNVANGGGGGNVMNCGGGGGSNGGVISNWNGMGNANLTYSVSWALEVPNNGTFEPTSSSGGGRGGYSYSSPPGSSNPDPTVYGPGNTTIWGSDSRHNDGGWGGIPLDYSTGKIFLGGGGGAGEENNNSGTSGGNGGGIVYLLSYGTVTGGGQILADGAAALSTNTGAGGTHGDDGAGGGGGGGAVFINSTGNITLTNTLSISAQGGVGGSMIARAGITTGDNFGPGGGGGGGYVATTNTVIGINVNGGANGIVVQNAFNATKIATLFPPNGATSGGAGTITATLIPDFYLTATNYTTCASSAVSLSVTVNGTVPSGLSIDWYTVGVGGTSVFSGNPYAITTPSTVGTYTYYAGTCPGTYRIPIIVTVTSTGGTVLSVSATNTNTCAGSSDTLSVSGANTYTWSANAGSAITSSVVVMPGVTTIYTVTGTSTGACAGTNTASISIIVNNTPTITITPTSSTLCSGSSATFTASGAMGYIWSANAGSATTNTVSVSPTSNTTYTVMGNNGTCTNTQTVSVTTDGGPTKADSVLNSASCGLSNGDYIINSVTGGVSPYQINFNGTSFTTIPSFPDTVKNLPGNTYSVIIKDGLGCIYTTTATIGNASVISKIDSVVTNANCVPANSGTITINSVIGGTAPYQASINGGAFNLITSFPYSFSNLTAGTYTVLVKDNTNCPHLSIINVGTIGVTSASITPQPDTCNKHVGTITLSNVVGGTMPYSYALNGGTYQTVNTFTALASGTDTIKIKDNTTGCVYTGTVAVLETGSAITPTITPSGPTIFCQGSSVTLTSSSASSYTWSTGATTQTITVNSTGTYSVIITSSTGCTATADTIVMVISTPTILVNNPNAICSGASTTLTASGAINYTWSPATGLSSTSTSVVIANPIVTTIYTVSGNCSSTNTVVVLVNPLPTLSLTPTATVVCAGNSATLTATGTATNYAWAPAIGLSATSGSMVTANPSSQTQYTVVGTLNTCTATATSIVATSTLQTSFIPNPDAGNAPLNVQFTNTSNGGTNYAWNYGNNLGQNTINLTDTSGTVYNNAGTYTVTLTASNALGCAVSYTTTITVLQSYSITIPNVFSPNGDGINDDFEVKATGITSLTCDIYDRWGLKLYTFNGASGYWDGSAKGGKEVDGTYFYVILTTDIKGDNHKYNGFIQLIR